MAAEASRSGGASADSYIGSLISLTSKSEIRYEGILYNINTEESSIGLRNVRSFGTEGRKKDGPQIPASDKIYEYILFRGSDIKDLQVKSSPPVQTTPLHHDPAIIQSHYSHPPSASASLPSVGSGTAADLSSHTAQLGLPRSTFQGSLPLYQPGGGLGSWGTSPTPPTANGSALAMPPMYWQGYYARSSGLPHLQQPPLLRPPPGLPIPHSMQQPLQYPGMNASLPSVSPNVPEFPSPLLQPANNTLNLSCSFLPSTVAPTSASALIPETPSNALIPETPSNLLPNKSPVASVPASTPGVNLPVMPPLTSSLEPVATMSQNMPSVVSSNPNTVPGPTAVYQTIARSLPLIVGSSSSGQVNLPVMPPLTSSLEPAATMLQNMPSVVSSNPNTVRGPPVFYQTISRSLPLIVGSSSSGQVETSVPLVIPGQLLQSGSSTLTSSQSLQTSRKDIEGLEAKPEEAKSKLLLPEPSVRAPGEAKEPILPLPKPTAQKTNGVSSHTHYNYRGRGRGRGNGYLRPVTRFTEDFDFMAMNEKFKKDEVWGHLGKSKAQFRDKDGEPKENEADDTLGEDEAEALKLEIKPVYVKDEFFDSLSCTTLDRGTQNARTRFSERLKIDSETFGDFPRHRLTRGGGRGLRGGGGGGGRARGSYYGRGYGYMGRGRGHAMPNRAP